jgi:hypothetical protein
VIEQEAVNSSPMNDCTVTAAAQIRPGTQLSNASHIWGLLEAITYALKVTPDQDLRLVANAVIARIEDDGLPRLLNLAQMASLYDWRPESSTGSSN